MNYACRVFIGNTQVQAYAGAGAQKDSFISLVGQVTEFFYRGVYLYLYAKLLDM